VFLRLPPGQQSGQAFSSFAQVPARRPELLEVRAEPQPALPSLRVFQTERQGLTQVVMLCLQAVQPHDLFCTAQLWLGRLCELDEVFQVMFARFVNPG